MLIETKHLTKIYKSSKHGKRIYAVKDAFLSLCEGETVGLFGESGSGKTTMGLMLSGLSRPSFGDILYNGQPIAIPYKGAVRQKIQVLFQHPETSFNPALPLQSSMNEPYQILGMDSSKDRLLTHLEQFGLGEEHLRRYPFELSGGELQRAALARILILNPRIIILDEPTSMLDVITQAQIMELLYRYQSTHGTSYLLISHNRAICEKTCSRIYNVNNGIFEEEKLIEKTAI